MAVAYDNSASSLLSSAASPWTWSHTVGAISNGYAIVYAFNWDGQAAPTAVSFGGTAMSQIDSLTDATWGMGIFAYGLATGSTSGAQTVSVTFASAVRGVGASESVSGATQSPTWTLGTSFQHTDAGAPNTVTLADPTNGLIVSGIGLYVGGGSGVTPTSSSGTVDQTQVNSSLGILGGLLHGSATGGSVTWAEAGATHDSLAISLALSPPAPTVAFVDPPPVNWAAVRRGMYR